MEVATHRQIRWTFAGLAKFSPAYCSRTHESRVSPASFGNLSKLRHSLVCARSSRGCTIPYCTTMLQATSSPRWALQRHHEIIVVQACLT